MVCKWERELLFFRLRKNRLSGEGRKGKKAFSGAKGGGRENERKKNAQESRGLTKRTMVPWRLKERGGNRSCEKKRD